MAFYGMRGTGDWVANQRPENWREAILRLYPNGMAPLTAMMSKMKSESTDDPKYHWWTKGLPTQAADITGVYNDSGLAVAYVSGGVSGNFLYLKMAESSLGDFREGHQVTMRDSSDLTADVVGKVVDRVGNGASSYLKVKLLEDDDNSTSHDLSDADRVLVSGNINSEGSAMPDAISYDPTEWYNYTQIFRTPLEITGTAIETKLRTNPQAYQELKRECLENHSLELEKGFLWGVPSSGIGDNGKIERTTLGLIPAIRGGYTGHGGSAGTVSDFATSSTYAGQSWLAGGESWLEDQLEIIFRYGSRQKLMLCGSGTLMAINKLVKNGGQYTFTPATNTYGINIMNWHTPIGSIGLLTHPLFSQESTTRNIGVIYEPENLKYKFIKNRDTQFIGESLAKTNSGWTRRDGIKEEYLTEAGLEYHHPIGWAYLTGFGSDNTA